MIEQVPKRFFCKLLKELEYVPCVIITDKLTSYRVVKLEIILRNHRQHKGINNKLELPLQATEKEITSKTKVVMIFDMNYQIFNFAL